MASVTLTVVGSEVGTLESGVTLTPDHSDRLMAFLTAMHGTDEQGNPRTPQQMIDSYWSGIVAGTVANVTRWEQEEAAKTARDAVTPITATPVV